MNTAKDNVCLYTVFDIVTTVQLINSSSEMCLCRYPSQDALTMTCEWVQGEGGQRRRDHQGPQKDLIKPYRIYMHKRRHTFYTPRMDRGT